MERFRNSTQDPEIFRLGIKRATKAIKNAIGPKVLDYFNTMSPVVSIIPQSVLAQPPHQIRNDTFNIELLNYLIRLVFFIIHSLLGNNR